LSNTPTHQAIAVTPTRLRSVRSGSSPLSIARIQMAGRRDVGGDGRRNALTVVNRTNTP
jgi:hypothetical protein